METKSTSRNLPWLAVLIVVWNTFDIALHVYVELVEPLRVAGNVAAIAAAAIVLLGLARNYAPRVLGLGAVVFIGFNIVESILHGFFVPSLVFISVSVFLLVRWAQVEWRKANVASNTANPIYLRWWAAILITLIAVAIVPLVGEARESDLDSLTQQHDDLYETRQYQFDGQQRQYHLYTPDSYDDESIGYLIYVLHGGTINALEMASLTEEGFNRLADDANVLIVYPEAANVLWNSGLGTPGNSRADDLGFLLQIADDLVLEYNIDPNKLFFTGISSGGYMSTYVACEVPERVAAIAPVSALPYMGVTEVCAEVSIPVMIFAGTADRLIPFEGRANRLNPDNSAMSFADTAEFWAAQNDCITDPVIEMLPDLAEDGTQVTRTSYKDCTADFEMLAIDGGGHTWPGGGSRSRLLGVTSEDVNASELIWAFFAENGLVTEE